MLKEYAEGTGVYSVLDECLERHLECAFVQGREDNVLQMIVQGQADFPVNVDSESNLYIPTGACQPPSSPPPPPPISPSDFVCESDKTHANMDYDCEFRTASSYQPFNVTTASSAGGCAQVCCGVTDCIGFGYIGGITDNCRIYDFVFATDVSNAAPVTDHEAWLCTLSEAPPPPSPPPPIPPAASASTAARSPPVS